MKKLLVVSLAVALVFALVTVASAGVAIDVTGKIKATWTGKANTAVPGATTYTVVDSDIDFKISKTYGTKGSAYIKWRLSGSDTLGLKEADYTYKVNDFVKVSALYNVDGWKPLKTKYGMADKDKSMIFEKEQGSIYSIPAPGGTVVNMQNALKINYVDANFEVGTYLSLVNAVTTSSAGYQGFVYGYFKGDNYAARVAVFADGGSRYRFGLDGKLALTDVWSLTWDVYSDDPSDWVNAVGKLGYKDDTYELGLYYYAFGEGTDKSEFKIDGLVKLTDQITLTGKYKYDLTNKVYGNSEIKFEYKVDSNMKYYAQVTWKDGTNNYFKVGNEWNMDGTSKLKLSYKHFFNSSVNHELKAEFETSF